MFKGKFPKISSLILALIVSPVAYAAVTIVLNTFTDQTPATIDLPATKLLMASVATSTQGGGQANDATATTVTIGGTVAAADIAQVCVDYGGTEVACVASPGSLTNISISLPGTQGGGAAFDYRVTLNPSSAGKTIFLSVVSVTATGSVTDNIPLPASTATRTISGGVTAPTVTSPTFADVTDTTATLGGNVTNDNGTTVTSRGIEWGTSPGGPYPNSVPEGGGGTGIFTVPVTGLPSSTTIYFRAWADNGATGHSSESSFTTNAPAVAPTVTTSAATGIGQNSATLGGDVTADGGAAVTARGVYWDTAPDSENGTQVSMGSGTGTFTQPVSGLPAGTLIYHRAYATNSAGTALGNELTFTTDPGLATVATRAVENITATSADLGGDVTSDGGATVTERGVVWNTTSPPEVGGTVDPNGSGTGPFIETVNGLPTGTLVYFRAYATNSAGTAYSAIQSFTPAGPPVVTATPAADILLNSATLGGNVTNDGGSAVTSHGIVWNTTTPPETGGTVVPMGSGTGGFSQTVTGLPAASTIFWKAYGTNSVATGYSAEESFSTLSEPTVQATNLSFATLAGRSMRLTWTRGNGEGVIVTMRLDTIPTPTAPQDGDDYTANSDFTLAPELPVNSQNFVVYEGSGTSVTVTGLTMSTGYSVAVYEYAGTGANIDYLVTTPAEGSASTTDYAVHNYDYGVDCGNCHDHGSFNSRDTELKAICETCHNPSGVANAKLEFDNHLAPNSNPAVDFVDCGVCHELHNLSGANMTDSFNNVTGQTQHNKSFLRANVDKYISTAVPPAYLHTDQPKRETPHPDAPLDAVTPDRAVEGGTDAVDPSTNAQARGYCQVCHTMTNYHTNNPSTSGSVQTHDGENNDQGLGTEVNCGHCHEHNNKFIGVGGTTTCVECHDSVQGSRPIIMTQFDRNSTHIQNGSTNATQDDCLVCHNQGSHTGGAVSVWNVDNGSTAYTQLSPGASTLATGEGEVFAPHCLSCHDSNGADSLPASGSDQTKLSPFTGTTKQPPIIGATNWSGAAHNIPTPSSTPMTCVGDGVNGCHGSGHGSEQNALLAPADTAPAASFTDFCMNCHDGTLATNVNPDFTGVERTATSASGAAVNNRHDPFGSGVTCAGCHDPHIDPAGVSVSDLINVDVLRNYSPSLSYQGENPFAYAAAGDQDPINPESVAPGTFTEPDYIQFCLACHDGVTPPGVTMTANMTNIATAYAADYHGSTQGNSGRRTGKGPLKPVYNNQHTIGEETSSPYAAMNCTTCHGAHNSENIFNLKTSITVAGQVLSTGSGGNNSGFPQVTTYVLPTPAGQSGQTDHYWGAWCTFCHDLSGHNGVDEDTACQNGHMHGGGAF